MHADTNPAIHQTHVLTWDYLGGTNGTHKVAWSQAALWLTWAMTGPVDSVPIKAAGMKTIFYSDPNRQSPGDPLYNNDETTFAHDCSGNRIYTLVHPGQAIMSMPSTKLHNLWKQYIQMIYTYGVFDAVYDDQSDEVQNATGTPCNFDQTAWSAASNAMNIDLGEPIIYNSLGNFSGSGKSLGISPTIALNASTLGGEAEGCYAAHSTTNPKPAGAVWQAYENTEITMHLAHKPFLCEGANHNDSASSTDLRLYMYASFLLTYSRYQSMISEQFATPTGFHVEPESQLVPTTPLVLLPASISGLQHAPGVYGREFAACYLDGVPVGACASVVNSNTAGVSGAFPWPGKYAHTLVLSGSGVLDGGTVSASGPAPPAQIAGNEAVIAIQ